MRERSYLQGLCVTISIACSLTTVFELFLAREGLNTEYYPLCFVAFLPAVYTLNYVLLNKERSIGLLLLINLPLTAGLIVFSVISCGITGFAGLLVRVMAVGMLTYYVVGLGEAPPALSTIFVALDTSVVLLLGSLLFAIVNKDEALSSILLLIACGTALLALIDCRMGRVLGPRGFAVVAVGLCGCGGLGLMFSRFLAGYAGAGLVAFAKAVFDALKYIVGLIGRFLLWLMTLIPMPEDGGELEEAAEDMAGLGETAMEEQPSMAAAFIALCAAIIIVAVVIVIVLRNVKLGGKRRAYTVKRQGSRPSLAEAFKMFVASLKNRLHRAHLLFSKRKTAGGVYFRLEKRYARTPLARRSGETPRNFLMRLRSLNGSDPEYSEAFDRLIAASELAFYAPGAQNVTFPGERNLYKLTAKQKACILKNANVKNL